MLSLGTIDFVVIGIYFAIILILGVVIAIQEKRSGSSGEDYFVAGRSLGWVAIGASLFASNISSEHLIGLSADGFRTGLAVGNYEWFASVVLIILGAVFVPFYVGSKIQTLPEFLEKRFGSAARSYLSGVTMLANIFVRISTALFAAGVVMESMFGVNFWVSIVVLSVVTVAYTAIGGLKAVVYTDVLQTVILLAGTILLSVIALDKVGGWDSLRAQLDDSMFTMIKPASDKEMPWTGLVIGVPILGIWYWCTDQVIAQRVLGARNIHQARMGTMFAGFLKILPVFLFVLPGLCGRVLFPEVEAKEIFPTLVMNLLPVGMKGLVAAALIAALMSSIDSTLNSTSALFSLDFYKKWFPASDEKRVVRVGQMVTLGVMIFGLLWVEVVRRQESLFQYLQAVNAAISPPIAAVFLFGVFSRRVNHKGAVSALMTGLGVGAFFIVYPILAKSIRAGGGEPLAMLNWVETLPFLLAAGVNFALSSFAMVTVSLATEPPTAKQIDGLTWASVEDIVTRLSTPGERLSFKVLACILGVCLISLWIKFS